jgi:hypothetical protein
VNPRFSLRSRYRAISGGRESRGFESKDHPARTVDDPESRLDFTIDLSLEIVLTTINDDRRLSAALLVALSINGLETFEGGLLEVPYFGRRRFGRVAPACVNGGGHGGGS